MRQSCQAYVRFLTVTTALVTILSFSSAVSAQDAQPSPAEIKQAAKAFDNAREAYGAEDFGLAADQFEKADAHAPSAVALQWAVESHHQAGHTARAATLAAIAKQRHPDIPELVELADRVIEESRDELLEVQIVCEEPCELFVDNKIVHGRPATTRTLYLMPGNYTLRASFGEDRMSKTEDLIGEAAMTRSVLLSAPSPEPLSDAGESSLEGMDDPFADAQEDDPFLDSEATAKPTSGWSPTVFWVGASLTAVSAGITTWSGLDTQKNPGREVVKEGCVGQGPDCGLYEDGMRRQRRTNLLLGVTGGLAVLTVVAALFTDWSGDEPTARKARQRQALHDRAWSVAPWMSVGNGAAVGATGRF